MRKALLVVGIAMVVLLAADFGLRALAQYWVSGQIQSSLELEHRPSVSLGGFPFLPRLVTGRFPSVTVEAKGSLQDGRFPVTALAVTLREVRFPPDQLLFGNKATINAERGNGSLVLTEQEINQAFPATIPITVRLADGKVHVRSSEGAGEAAARLRVSGNRLLLIPVQGSLPVEVRVALPVLVPGLTYTDARIDGSRAIVTFRLSKPRIRVA